MATTSPQPNSMLETAFDASPVMVVRVVDGVERVFHFASDDDADRFLSDSAIQGALSVVGAWSDLDWEEVLAELYRIRHQSTPTPPIEFDFDEE